MDSDLFDDFLVDNAVKTARAGGKFQPKAKPRGPRLMKKDSIAPTLTSSEPVQTSYVSESELNEYRETKMPAASGLISQITGLLTNDHRSFGVVNASPQQLSNTKNVGVAALGPVMDVFMPDTGEDWDSCFEKSVGENADIFIGLESLGDFLPDSTTVLDDSVPSSEAHGHVSGKRNAEHKLANPPIPAADGSGCLSNVPNVSSQSEFSAAHVSLSVAEPIVSTTGSLTDNSNLETEELETYPCQNLDMPELTTSSGRQTGKFLPKSKMRVHGQGSEISVPNVDVVEPVLREQDMQSVSPEIDIVDRRSVPSFTTDDVLDFSSVRLSHTAPPQTTPEVLVDPEPRNLMEAFHQEACISGEHLEAVPEMPVKLASRRAKSGKSENHAASDHSLEKQMASTSNETEIPGRSLRKRKKHVNAHKLVDEPDDQDLDNGDFPAESLSNSVLNEDDESDEEFRLEDESQTKKVRKMSKKPTGDKEKPPRKRKKDTEASDQAAKAAPKKFSHSTRRRVDKALLETPEDEIDFQKVPLRDLILLAEYKERMAKKEATTSQAPLPNLSTGNYAAHDNEDGASNAFACYDEDEAFASEQGGEVNDKQDSPSIQETSSYFNYQTYMDKTPIARWSKQDTELFYEAVQQFGTDLSMIQQLFPGKTRRQVKLKYKKEERQHPLRLREALSNRAKDNSHFELVIERLKQIAAEVKQNSGKADSISLIGEEEGEEETSETNAEAAKSEQMDKGVVDQMEPDFPKTQSPVKSHDSEDEFFLWSQYKSEL